MAEIRALTIKQPWAHFIAKQEKRVENRSWPTDHRNLLAIHAGAYSGWDEDAETSPVALEAWKRWAGVRASGEVATPLTRGDAYSFFSFGAVIAVADLTGCHYALQGDGCAFADSRCSPWAVLHAWHWQLANVRPLAEPVRARGKLGLWRLPEDVEATVRAQLKEADHGRS
jgi:hypothetical protein